MFEMMRKVFGPAAVTLIVGSIAMVFVFYGVFNPKGGGGVRGGEGAVAVTVNGEGVSMQDYAREYQARTDYFQGMMKGKADPKLLAQLGLKQQVIEELVRRKILLQEARRAGFHVSDAEVRDKIAMLPYFQKEGHFDSAHYQAVLEANRRSPSEFEDMMREDLLRMHVVDFIKEQARVTDNEVEQEYRVQHDERQIDYVVVDRDAAKKRMMVTEKETDDLLKTEQGMAAAKAYYEQHKMNYMKPAPKAAKTVKKGETPKAPEAYAFEEVKSKVAAEVVKDRRTDELNKITHDLANEVLEKAKTQNKDQVAAFAKSKSLEVKSTEKFNRERDYVPGVGEIHDLVQDAFSDHSPLVEGPKMYSSRGGFVVVLKNFKAFKPELAELSKSKETLARQLAERKEQGILEQWMTDARGRAKVTMNKSLEKAEAADTESEN